VSACPTHGPQVGYRYGGDGPLVCAVPSRDGGLCHRPLMPLGQCSVCFRVRYLAEVDETADYPLGVCTQCERDRRA
jgi:hypothetical protein